MNLGKKSTSCSKFTFSLAATGAQNSDVGVAFLPCGGSQPQIRYRNVDLFNNLFAQHAFDVHLATSPLKIPVHEIF